jgi:hypothetical protein
MVQTTDYSQAKKLSYETRAITYYYDEEGRLVDRKNDPDMAESTDPAIIFSRAYAVKLFVDDVARPGYTNQPGKQSTDGSHEYRVLVAMAPYNNELAMKQLGDISTSENFAKVPSNSPLKIKVLTIARMESEPL